ncbi:hypothetical protein Hdeb2414_s0009g00308051 [Helianthus debilis subsp. tardiflorus]
MLLGVSMVSGWRIRRLTSCGLVVEMCKTRTQPILLFMSKISTLTHIDIIRVNPSMTRLTLQKNDKIFMYNLLLKFDSLIC